MRHQSVLAFERYRYLKLAAALTVAAIAIYVGYAPPNGRYGGTVVGYILGTVGALLILLMLYYGIRKRRYTSRMGTLPGWLSAHVYLGAALIVVVTLHAAFEVGWNVHTLAYVLMLAVIVSGFFGVYAYLVYPPLVTDNLGEDTLDQLLIKITDIDRQARQLALSLPDPVNQAVLAAAQGTAIGGTSVQQLRGTDPRCPTAAAIRMVEAANRELSGPLNVTGQQLYALLLRKEDLLGRARRDVQLKARLDIWLYVHVPLSIALFAALTAHIVSVFFYW